MNIGNYSQYCITCRVKLSICLMFIFLEGCGGSIYLNTNEIEKSENLATIDIRYPDTNPMMGLRIDGLIIDKNIRFVYLKPGLHIIERDKYEGTCTGTRIKHIIYKTRTGLKLRDEYRKECVSNVLYRTLRKGEFTFNAGKKYELQLLGWSHAKVVKKVSPFNAPKGYLWDKID